MKKIISILIILSLLLFVFSGCAEKREQNSSKYKIVTTSFSAFDWARNIIGDSKAFSVDLICDNGTDIHSYQPTAADIISIKSSDLFIYIGSPSNNWTTDVLNQSDSKINTVNMLETVGNAVLKESEEGILEDTHKHEHDHADTYGTDEHIWLSLKNAVAVSKEITEKLSLIDKENSDLYNSNLEDYKKKLLKLYDKYNSELENKKNKPLIFADRFPFRYLTEEFGLKYYACFNGCSTETEASFDAVIALADKINEYNISSVIIIDGTDKKLAKTVIDNTKEKNQRILTLNSMQSVTSEQIDGGLTYFSAMEENLKLISQAIN